MNTVIVTTAVPLTDALRQEVQRVVKQKLGHTANHDVSLQEVVDPQVVGGICLTINSRQYDASVRGKLAALRDMTE